MTQLTLFAPDPPAPSVELREHTGRPLVRRGQGGRVTVLCPLGHLVWSIGPASWAGSWYAAAVADPAYEVTCEGAVAIPTTPTTTRQEGRTTMPTTYAGALPQVPADRWNADSHGHEGDIDEGTAKSFVSIDAGSAEEAELRVLAWLDHDFDNDVRDAVATADPGPVRPGRWRVTVAWGRPRD